MRKLIVTIMFLTLLSVPLHAGTWCTWSGTMGENCQSDSKGYIKMPDGHPIAANETNLNYHGFYERIITQPTIGEDQVRDAEVWGFADNEISLTWSVRDMTATELDNRAASPMSVSDYYLWKAFIAGGVFTQAQLVTYFQANQPEMIEAYQARDRLLNP